jgi:NADPH:quinone reductase-like Zn-dependent oxidoreductase
VGSRPVTQAPFGGPEVLTLTDVPAPVPGPTEVIVRMRATSFNAEHVDVPVMVEAHCSHDRQVPSGLSKGEPRPAEGGF